MSRIVRVLPDVPTLALDDGFLYTLSEPLEARVGSIVRAPLSGRTVRGTVLAVGEGDATGLRPIKSVSPALAVFDEHHLALYRWLAAHYVAPLAAVLRSVTPPNLPRSTRSLPDAPDRRGRGGRRHLITADQVGVVARLVDELDAGVSALVVAPTAIEAERIAAALPGATLVKPDDTAAAITSAWVQARTTAGMVLVGTPRVASWPVAALGLTVLVDDGRRGHKDRQTPTIHARTVLVQRSRFEGIPMVATGLVPALELAGTGATIEREGGRSWAPVEVVDRTEDPPGTGFLSRRGEVAVARAVAADRRVAVFTHRRGYAPSFRCIKCRTIRTCGTCGSRVTETGICGRCGSLLGACSECNATSFEPLGAAVGAVTDRLRRVVGAQRVGGPDDDRTVVVVTERDLPALPPVDLALVIDADALLLGPSYRSTEDGLRLLARVAARVSPGTGHRCMVQTASPGLPAIEALRRGDPREWIASELELRELLGFPPAGEVIVVEVRGAIDGDPLAELGGTGASVLGPVTRDDGARWLLQGRDLAAARRELRPIARRLRDRGAEVRIDVDPIDL